jgi:hypothetical protein
VGTTSRPAKTGRIDFSAIVKALTSEEHKRQIEEGFCFKFNKTGCRLFQCLDLKGKAAMEAPTKKE